MKVLLRPLVAIITLTFSLMIINAAKTFFAEDEATIQVAQISHFSENYSGAGVTYFQPGDFPCIINNTDALEVKGLAKSSGYYQLRLKNNSNKNVVAYCLSFGNRDIELHGTRIPRGTVIAPGETYQQERLWANDSYATNITITAVVFDDDSFEGDLNFAAEIVACREGIRIQSSSVLQMIERTLAVDDASLCNTFEKLEPQLAVTPEAVDKESALELLKSKYPCFDKKMIGWLYECFKMGLYEGKNMAHCPVGNIRQALKGLKEESTLNKETLQINLIRERLNQIKKNFGELSQARYNRI
jgi:hypothetical protein